MKAVVVYESLWGNTATIARAIAEGIGPEARVLTTAAATAAEVADADLIVAGAPVIGFKLPTDKMREGIRRNPGRAPAPPDLSHPAMQSWLEALPPGTAVAQPLRRVFVAPSAIPPRPSQRAWSGRDTHRSPSPQTSS